MPYKLSAILASFWLAAILVFASAPSVLPSGPTVFTDCDGDGFDDNAPDDDTDGIPDEVERHGFVSASVGQLQVSQMFTNTNTGVGMQAHLHCKDAFGRRKFAARAVSEDRLDFDTGFGSGLGLGGGLGAGGGCAGGVCF